MDGQQASLHILRPPPSPFAVIPAVTLTRGDSDRTNRVPIAREPDCNHPHIQQAPTACPTTQPMFNHATKKERNVSNISQATTPAENTSSAKIVYILYLVGLVLGITALVGLIMAYINKTGNDGVANSHYRFQIRTFWIGLLMMLVGSISAMIIIGWFIMLFWLIWTIIRCVKGMKYLEEGVAVPNPKSWMFGS